MMRVAIMQPTYLPWVGYFGLMKSVDLFILLDSVQFARRSWQQRNQIKTANKPLWLTVPVISKGRRDQLIAEVEIDRSRDFPLSHQKALELNYGKSEHFDSYASQLFTLMGTDNKYLADLNIEVIFWIRNVLGITTPITRSSKLDVVGAKAELLASICDQVGATEYISPPGSKDYLAESDAFARRGIPLRYFKFTHPEYPKRFGEFLPYMSVVDLLFNCGSQSLSLIEKGCEVSQ